MLRSFLLTIILACGAAYQARAQEAHAPRPSILFGSTVPTRAEMTAVVDTVEDKKIAAAIGFGVVGASLGGIIAGGGDDGFLPSTPTIIVFGVVGAVAGYITGGRSTE